MGVVMEGGWGGGREILFDLGMVHRFNSPSSPDMYTVQCTVYLPIYSSCSNSVVIVSFLCDSKYLLSIL